MINQGKIPGRISTYSRAPKQGKTSKQKWKKQGTEGGKETKNFFSYAKYCLNLKVILYYKYYIVY